MWEAIGEAIKSFLEKRLLPTIISIALTCLGLYITPDDFPMLVKLEKPLYTLLLFSVCFIVVTIIYFLILQIKQRINSAKEKAYYTNEKKKYEKEQLKVMWDYIDGLSPAEYDIIIQFLKTKNKPMQVYGEFSYNSLFSSDYVISSKIGAKVATSSPKENATSDDIEQVIWLQSMYQRTNMYMLEPKIYNTLLFSIRNYKRICNFATLTLKDIGEDG